MGLSDKLNGHVIKETNHTHTPKIKEKIPFM